MDDYQSFRNKCHLFIIDPPSLISLKSLRKLTDEKRLYFEDVDTIIIKFIIISIIYRLLKT